MERRLVELEKRQRDRQEGVAMDLEGIRETAIVAARAALDVKGEDVTILDVHELVSYTDFMVMCTGRNTRLTRRIAEEVAHKVKGATGILPTRNEGSKDGEWILIDFLDFVVHVFTPEARDFYRLEVLWKEAPTEVVSE